MDADYLAQKESEIVEGLGAAASELQVALTYEDVLGTRDYSRVIKTLDSVCQAFYREGRDILEEIESEGIMRRELSEFNNYTGKSDKAVINEGKGEWMYMSDAGEASEAVEQHQENLGELDLGEESIVNGRELKNWIQMYEEIRAESRRRGIYNFEPIDEPLMQNQRVGDILREGDDAEVFR